MSSGRLALGITKVLTCIVGFGIAGLLIWSLGPDAYYKLHIWWGLGGALIGLCVGLCWASGRKEMRIAFIMPLLVGLLAFWAVMSSHEVSPHRWYPQNISLLLLLALVILVIGSVWALARTGAFKTKQEQETAPKASGVDVIEQLRELASLKSEGILTDQEFESKKQELLARL